MTDLTPNIADNAAGPKSATVDGNTFTQHSLRDQIEADKHIKSQSAAAGSKRGFQLGRFKPPGTV